MENIINLDKYDLKYDKDDSIYIFNANNRKYFFKTKNKKSIVKELLGEELAKNFGLNYVHYDYAEYKNNKGVVCEDFVKNSTYTNFIEILLYEYDKEYFKRDTCNLYDIWNALYNKYKDEKLVYKLMNQLTDIFLFDFLIGNNDRHDGNIGVLENSEDINITPVFDNEELLKNTIDYYSILKVDDEKINDWKDSLLKFLLHSTKEYKEKLKEKICIIDEENIDNAIERVEKRLNEELDENLKIELKGLFSKRKNEIEKLFINKQKKSY